MTLRRRLERLERSRPDEAHPEAVALDVPGRGNLMRTADGWIPCPDVRAILAAPGPVKVYLGFNPDEHV